MKLIFAGTPEFAVPALAALIDAGHEHIDPFFAVPRSRQLRRLHLGDNCAGDCGLQGFGGNVVVDVHLRGLTIIAQPVSSQFTARTEVIGSAIYVDAQT